MYKLGVKGSMDKCPDYWSVHAAQHISTMSCFLTDIIIVMDIPSYLLFTILVVITTIQYSGSQGEVIGDVETLVWLYLIVVQ